MSHVLDVLLEPLFAALLLILLSYVLSRRQPRVAAVTPALALAVLLVFSTPAVSNHLVRGLEQPAITTMKPGVTYDAVIVLGGAINSSITAETGNTAFNGSAERVVTGFDLLQRGIARNAVLTGGVWPGSNPAAEPESRVTARQLAAWGIDPSRLVAEERSVNTHENAVETARIVRARGWTRLLLVTSAAHMTRALGCFAREGLPVDSLSVDFESHDPDKSPADWLPRAGALEASTRAIRERAGRIVYRARGWSL